MKIKKSNMAAKNAGGAAINERLRLDNVAPAAPAGTISPKAAAFALTAGIIALALAGVLTYILYDHWEFLKGA